MDAVRKLILDKALERTKNLAELSKAIGRNHAYLQQFIHRGVPRNLPESVRPKLAAELKVSAVDLMSPDLRSSINPVENNPNDGIVTKRNRGVSLEAEARIPGRDLIGIADLPVFGTAQGGRGALILSNDAVDRVVRPDPLLKVRDGYGMIVTGESMSPAHKAGSIALVNPHLPPRAEDVCVFRRVEDDGTELAIIKELRRYTDTTWYVRQYNPKRDFTLSRAEWQICHVTVGNYSRR